MSKKILAIVSLVLALSLGASGAWGALENIPDTTLVQVFSGQNPFGGVQDVVGLPLFTPPTAGFQTFNATFDTLSHVLTIYTNWAPNLQFFPNPVIFPTTSFTTADLFLNYNPNNNTAFAAVHLAAPGVGITAEPVFFNPTITTTLGLNFPSGVLYGGTYTPNSSPVPVIASGPSTGTVDVTWTANTTLDPNFDPFPIPANQPGGPPLFSVSLDLDNIAGFSGNGFVWGTATCGNDVITPIPPTLLLLGSGLLGLGALRLRRKSV